MDDTQIEKYLSQLENGEISEDENDIDENSLDYYEDAGDLVVELQDQEEQEFQVTESFVDSDPPLMVDHMTKYEPECTNYPNTRNLVWKRKNMGLVEQALQFEGQTEYPKNILELETPYQFFTYFFENSLLEKIVLESNKYATQQNPNFADPLTKLELRKYIGILIYTSVYHYPNIRSYWASNVRFDPIADVMTVNRFEKIRQIIHFNDNSNHLPPHHPQHDRIHKIRPIVDYLNQQFRSVPFDHRLSVDEQMCSTKISHFMKQYLPNKPHKWGFKFYVLCCLSGYAYSFEIYSGMQNHNKLPNEPDLGTVSNTVIRLLRPVPRKVNHIIFFDNFYSNLRLFHYLHNEGIYCLGTIQRNRLGKGCKLPDKKDILKSSVARGSYDENVATFEGVEFSATSWKDNKQVLMLSTYVGTEPVDTITRFDKKKKQSVEISCPRAIREYNANMGGVDTMDSYLGRYRIRMKSKKWTNRLFHHMLDMATINSWVLYKKVMKKKSDSQKKIMNLVDFRTNLAETLCKFEATSGNKRGRPCMNRIESTHIQKRPKINSQTIPPVDVRMDGIGHNKSYSAKRNQCKYDQCKKLTSIICTKCKVSLCDNRKNNCFELFH